MEYLVFYRKTRGLGDAIMMLSAVDDICQQVEARSGPPNVSICLQEKLLPVFWNHPRVPKLIPLGQRIPMGIGVRFCDFSSACAQYESKVEPLITRGRPEIWIRSCGFDFHGIPPCIYLSDEEKAFARRYRQSTGGKGPVIGVGYKSIEAWRDYPYMDELIHQLAKSIGGTIVVLHNEKIEHQFPKNVVVETSLPLRTLFSVVSACDVVVSPDTAQIHIAGATGRKIYGIFGPTDGRIRLDDYKVPYTLSREFRPCGRQPCWYHPCSGKWCLQSLSPTEIVYEVKNLLLR